MELTKLRGINEKRAAEFKKLGITNAESLVRYYPRSYLDMTSRVSVREVFHNDMALIACRIVRLDPVRRTSRVSFVRAWFEQDGDYFSAVWFNAPYVAQKLTDGEYLLYGRVQNKYGQLSVLNPSFERLERNIRLKGLVPVYPLKGALTQYVVREAIKEALKCVPSVSIVPDRLQKKYALMSLSDALRGVHAPTSHNEALAAAERIAVEEYFTLISAFKFIKGDANLVRERRYGVGKQDVEAFERRFPFAFTAGQKAAVGAIYENLTSPHRMNRLLQGDVGSGKTAVALTGIFMAVKSGYQAVYLSPTEVLAAQNYALLCKLFPDYRVGYLSGGVSAKEKREMKEALARGEIDILCGTHAVLQADVRFRELAFCVCDEQHRFGVAQRNILSEKGENPDILVMSATPIPRTLSLIFYGDLDVTTITDKPAGRQEVATSVIPSRKYEDMLRWIASETKRGRQAYFVCPKIDDDEGEVTSVTELYSELKEKLHGVRLGLLHGRMKEKEKTEITTAFKQGEFDCLVSTTVIEVGVDVPNATVMVIYNAERFGLSQLHQLRGRVGRGAEKSYCFLLTDAENDVALERLSVLKNTSDGFALAEKDLEMRGGGDFLGTRQSGKFLTEIKNLRYSARSIFLAKKLVDEAFEQHLDFEKIHAAAMLKYESLKDVVLN